MNAKRGQQNLQTETKETFDQLIFFLKENDFHQLIQNLFPKFPLSILNQANIKTILRCFIQNEMTFYSPILLSFQKIIITDIPSPKFSDFNTKIKGKFPKIVKFILKESKIRFSFSLISFQIFNFFFSRFDIQDYENAKKDINSNSWNLCFYKIFLSAKAKFKNSQFCIFSFGSGLPPSKYPLGKESEYCFINSKGNQFD
jgi:hypothetical protein